MKARRVTIAVDVESDVSRKALRDAITGALLATEWELRGEVASRTDYAPGEATLRSVKVSKAHCEPEAPETGAQSV